MIYSLFSCKIYDKPDEFCKYLIKHTLDKKNSRIAVGKIIIELLSRNLFTTETITQGYKLTIVFKMTYSLIFIYI